MSTLVIVESPAKAHTVGKILGSGYVVKASVGHVCDLPDHALGIAISEDGRRFTPEYVVPDDKKRTVSDLVRAAKAADEVLLASDPDREGEAIAWHVRNIVSSGLGKAAAKKPFHRVEYNEITPAAVRAAVASPHEIDMRRVDAQQARRLLDRLVGWKVSPSLRRAPGIPRTGAAALSAGRVQSVALRLVCDREKEVRAFVPVPYWDFSVLLRRPEDAPQDAFRAQLLRLDGEKPEIHDEARAGAVHGFLSSARYSVAKVSTGQKKRNPGAPFTTSTLQQRASTVLGFAPDATMRLAQDLYEHSLITYMRTDSRAVSKEAQAAAGAFIAETWGKEFAAPHTYGNKAGAQAAHECIRPTDPRTTPANVAAALDGVRDPARAARLYGLIWHQFVTSQMAPAVYETVSVEIAAAPGAAAPAENAPREATLGASTARVTFPGFLRADPERAGNEAYDPQKPASPEEAEDAGGEEHDSAAVAALPPLSSGAALEAAAAEGRRKETKPRPRFNEASLVRELERNGIGRPSTFAATIATLKNRRYVESRSRVLTPTELGFAVSDYLVARFPELLDVAFTAKMESQLDEVEDPEKSLDWQAMLADFNARLQGWLKAARGPAADMGALGAVLGEFLKVREWAPSRQVGKRVYDDLAFVQDIANDAMGLPRRRASSRKKAAGDAPAAAEVPAAPPPAPNASGYAFDPARLVPAEITGRQMDALLRILVGYRKQLPDLDSFLASIGREDVAAAPGGASEPGDPRVAKIFETVASAGVPERAKPFFESLKSQFDAGRALSPRQVHALEGVLLEASPSIPGWSRETCESLGVEWKEPGSDDPELAADLVSALGRVTEWAEPVKRGARTFDDRAFYVSVASQFGTRKRLSDKQVAALRRMFQRYFAQIPDAAAIAAKHGIEQKPARKKA